MRTIARSISQYMCVQHQISNNIPRTHEHTGRRRGLRPSWWRGGYLPPLAALGGRRRRAPLLRKLQIANNLKVQRQRHALGRLGSEELARRSPHAPLRDLILGQADLAKRQANVARFVDRFTRPAQDGAEEDTWWLYCADTGIKLLPVFLATLARAFLDGTGYLDAVREVCALQGTISDDGEAWVDKHSGYAIVPIDYDDDEGYDEEFEEIEMEGRGRERAAKSQEKQTLHLGPSSTGEQRNGARRGGSRAPRC